MRILVVEDDPALRLGIRRMLQSEGWQVDVVTDGELALTAVATADYDAAVLDLGLPRRDGMQVLRAWREQRRDLAVLILTARDELGQRVQGLNDGADDFLAKPFESPELVARLRAITRRRSKGLATNLLRIGAFSFDTESRELRCGDERLPLSPREAALVELLMASPGKAVPKSRIVSAMSTWETDFSANAVEIYILKLRRKLAGSGVAIVTVRGVGYAMEAEPEQGAGAGAAMKRALPWTLRRATSLRRKLVGPLLWTWVASAVLASLAAFWLTGRSTQLVMDRALRDDAVALASQIRWDAAGPRLAIDSHTAASMVYDSFAPTRYTLRTDEGIVLAGNAELSLPEHLDPDTGPGTGSGPGDALFFDHSTHWGRLRQVALHVQRPGSSGVWVIVGESVLKRQILSKELAWAIFLPAIALGFLIVPLLLTGVRRGLEPAQAVSQAMARRGIDDLSPCRWTRCPTNSGAWSSTPTTCCAGWPRPCIPSGASSPMPRTSCARPSPASACWWRTCAACIRPTRSSRPTARCCSSSIRPPTVPRAWCASCCRWPTAKAPAARSPNPWRWRRWCGAWWSATGRRPRLRASPSTSATACRTRPARAPRPWRCRSCWKRRWPMCWTTPSATAAPAAAGPAARALPARRRLVRAGG